MAATRLALLRGINVGGKNRLPMAALVELFRRAGCRDVRTHIQSGNVIFTADAALASRLPSLLGTAIPEAFGFEAPVFLRTAREMEAIAAANPFLDRGAPAAELHVAFLDRTPAAASIARLDPRRSPPDELLVHGREVYLHLPSGVARTRLTNAYLDATLGATSTLRSWRTVLRLAELTRRPTSRR